MTRALNIRCLWLCLAFTMAISATALSSEPVGGRTPWLTGDLPRVLAEAAPDERIPVSLVLRDQLTGRALLQDLEQVADRSTRRRLIIGRLVQHAARTQQRVRLQLRSWERERGRVAMRALWIGNVIGAELTAQEIQWLQRLSEIDHINWNPKRDVFLGDRRSLAVDSSSERMTPELVANEVECGVQQMQATRVWNELGVTGQGAVVAVIDTGVCPTHSDITNQIWINPGEDLDHDGVLRDPSDANGIDDDGNGFIDDLWGWDFANNDNDPDDDNQHGSHCAGTVAGDGTAGTQAGVAPDAKVMSVKVGVTFADEVDVWNAMQYAAAAGADVISMSLGWPHSRNPDRATWRTNCNNTIDLGTAMVVAAGNEGFGVEPDNVRTPGDVPRVITVGAVDCADTIAYFSSRGPVSWQNVPPFSDHPYPPGLIKPDVSAPGVNTKSHAFCSGYSWLSGTSMATPHVAGTAALMFSAYPSYLPDDVKQVLEDTSIDRGAPGKDNEYGSGRVDAFEAVAFNSGGPAGRISIREQRTACSGILNITLRDSDLRGVGTTVVRIESPTEPLGEPVTLTETRPGSGAFRGSIVVTAGAAAPDGQLQIAHAETATAVYIDANDGAGGTNVRRTANAIADCLPPRFSNVRSTDRWLDSATIRWSTDEASDSRVDYGTTRPPGFPEVAPGLVTDHAVSLFGLEPCTTYYYSVTSADSAGNLGNETAGGAYFHFETLGDFGQGVQACRQGVVSVDSTIYSCQATLSIRLEDIDLNRDPAAIDRATVEVTSGWEFTPERVTLTELDLDVGVFSGSIATTAIAPTTDGAISVRDSDRITVSYRDASDGSGAAARTYTTATTDCRGPVIRNVRVAELTDQRGTIRFDTDELVTDEIEWGTTPALGNVIANANPSFEHSGLIREADNCAALYFRLRATDWLGNVSISDNLGTPHRFRVGSIPGLYYRETFEGMAPGWTLQGEWEVGPPQELGVTGVCEPDPALAYNNAGVLGHDLTGLGAEPGAYEANLTGESAPASSPTFDATTWTNTKLILYKHLNVEIEDDAQLMMFMPDERMLYTSQPNGSFDRDYEYRSWDLSVDADGRPAIRFEFRQDSDAQLSCSGWNVDDFILKNGALPDYGPCGGCVDGPSFAGAIGANDNDACASTGVTLSWTPAASWGSGGGGTYSVYREASAGFTPTATNRVAIGVAGTTWLDAAAPEGQLYYLVRAENDELCATGPANGGVTDQNTTYRAVEQTSSRPEPEQVRSLVAQLVGGAHVRLSWAPASGASSYQVHRSESPGAGFATIGNSGATEYEDSDQGSSRVTYFYLVRGVNSCSVQGP